MDKTSDSIAQTRPVAKRLPEGTVILGATVEAFDAEPDADGSRWVELAYAVSMAESEVTLSREDFERCVANFARYPCVPVVIEHADTDWFGDRAWKEPHGYVEALRVGEREVTEMSGASRRAATLEGRVSFDEATAPTVGPGRKWRFGSVTLLKGAVDEATGVGLGTLLWSWSLTAHPRLTGLSPIAASLDLTALTDEQAARLRDALNRHTTARAPVARDDTSEINAMHKYLELSARFGLAATSEDDARDKVIALAALGADALKALALPSSSCAQALSSRLSAVTVAAARVPSLEQEVTSLRADRDARERAELDQHLAELFAVRPELKAAESALRYQSAHDPERFRQEHPRPSPAERAQAAQHPERLAPIVPPAAPTGASPVDPTQASLVLSVVHTHIAMARAEGRDLSFGAALQELGA